MSDALERLKKRDRPKVATRDTAIETTISQKNKRKIKDQETTLDIKTKQTTIRLEVNLSQRLTQSANKLGICREALIEALFECWEKDSTVRESVIQTAHEKNALRQQVANYRRAQSMMKKFGGH